MTRRRATSLVAVLVALCGAILTGCAAQSAATSACTDAGIQITSGEFGVGHGHFGGALLFWNRGTTACELSGYPAIRALGGTAGGGVSVQHTPRGYVGGLLSGNDTPPQVLLSPGGVASAILEGTTRVRGASGCATYRGVLVGVPGAAATTTLAVEASTCRRLQIHPVVSGGSGNERP
jgi:Protein of unknown function (DUF4232)